MAIGIEIRQMDGQWIRRPIPPHYTVQRVIDIANSLLDFGFVVKITIL